MNTKRRILTSRRTWVTLYGQTKKRHFVRCPRSQKKLTPGLHITKKVMLTNKKNIDLHVAPVLVMHEMLVRL